MAAPRNFDPITRLCSHCQTGIRSSALFAECTFCRLPYCFSCRFEHQANHQQAIVIVRSVIYQFEAADERDVCFKCTKPVSLSYSCCECEYALCRTCWFEQDIDTHQHKTFNVVELPRLFKGKAGIEALCCTVPAVNHCSTCATGLSLGQESIFCKTCYVRTNEPVSLCVRCHISSKDSHPQHHEFWHWTVEVEKPGGLAQGVHCNDCFQVIRSVDNLQTHPHTSYINVYTEERFNRIVARSYRQCQKKAARFDKLIPDGSDRCTMCMQRTLSSAILSCHKCNEINKLCAHCGQHARKLHIHDLSAENLSSNPRLSGATAIQDSAVATPLRSSSSVQSPKSLRDVKDDHSSVPSALVSPIQSTIASPEPSTMASPLPSTVASPVPSAISSPVLRTISNASVRSPLPSSYRAIQPPWERSYNEKEPYIIYGANEYPLQQGQDGLKLRSLSDPAVVLPRTQTPPESPQPIVRAAQHKKPEQRPQKLQLSESSRPATPPASPQLYFTGSPNRAPEPAPQSTQISQPMSVTSPIVLRPDIYGQSSTRPETQTQPRQSPNPASPPMQTSPQSGYRKPSQRKPAPLVSPSQISQPVYASQIAQPTYPNQSQQSIYADQSRQPAYPSQSSQSTHPSQKEQSMNATRAPQPTYASQNQQSMYLSRDLQSTDASQSSQPTNPGQNPQATYASQKQQSIYASQNQQNAYPSQDQQATYPRQSPQPASPSQNSQATHPSQNQPATYPSQSAQLVNLSQNQQPIYPSQSRQPAYPSQNSQPTYPSQSQQPAYPNQEPQPTYPTASASGQPGHADTTESGATQRPHPIQHAQTMPDVSHAPPIQRLDSAPQILMSTPEHPQEDPPAQQKRNKFAGIKKAYDVTQKNAATRFATRVVAKTAFGAVSNVIGADIGGIVDAAGGLNLGGTGIDAGNLVGQAVTSTANAAFDEAIGDEGRPNHGGSRWKNLKPGIMGRQGMKFGSTGGGVR